MKKGLSVLMIAAAFIFAACDSSGGGTPPEDNPQTGEMTAATAAKIFDSKNVSGGLEIVKFKGAAALETYLSKGSGSVAAFRAPNRAPGDTVFF